MLLAAALVWGATFVFIKSALPATALALPIQLAAQPRATPHRAALLLTLEPVFAALTAYLFLGERLGGRGLAGCGLILAAMLVAESPVFLKDKDLLTEKGSKN